MNIGSKAGTKRKEKERREYKNYRHETGKDICFVSCTFQWMQSHTTFHLENKGE
jgi:hypothetical protein